MHKTIAKFKCTNRDEDGNVSLEAVIDTFWHKFVQAVRARSEAA